MLLVRERLLKGRAGRCTNGSTCGRANGSSPRGLHGAKFGGGGASRQAPPSSAAIWPPRLIKAAFIYSSWKLIHFGVGFIIPNLLLRSQEQIFGSVLSSSHLTLNHLSNPATIDGKRGKRAYFTAA
jgi:hypothetical protein